MNATSVKLLYVGRGDMQLYDVNIAASEVRKLDELESLTFPVDSNDVPYRGPLALGINAVMRFQGEIEIVLLDAGAGERMSLIGVVEDSKGKIRVQNRPLWELAALNYAKFYREVLVNNNNNIILFGAADTLLDKLVEDKSGFLQKARDYFEPSKLNAKLFMFSTPLNKSSDIVIPYTNQEQVLWFSDFIFRWLGSVEPYLPFAHLIREQLTKLNKSRSEINKNLPEKKISDLAILPSELKGLAANLLRPVLLSDRLKQHGGLRLPFLYCLSKEVVERLHNEFFKDISACDAWKLDWYTAFLLVFHDIPEPEFVRIHNALSPDQSVRLYRLLSDIKRSNWSPKHIKASQDLSDIIKTKLSESWWALESPLDLFQYIRHKGIRSHPSANNNIFIYTDGEILENNANNISINSKSFPPDFRIDLVLAGKIPKSLPDIVLNPPKNEIARRSDYFPYMIYFSSSFDENSVELKPLNLEAHDVCVISFDDKQNTHHITKAIFTLPSRIAMQNTKVFELDDEWKDNGRTVRQFIQNASTLELQE